MIYKLDQYYLSNVYHQGGRFICMSTEGQYFLASNDTPFAEVEVLESYPDEAENELLRLDMWQQPRL